MIEGSSTSEPTESLPTSDADGLSEGAFRRQVRSRFTEVEIDLILELLTSVPVAVWAAGGKDDDYAVQLWSPGAEKLYGFEKDEIFGQNYIEMFVNKLERTQAAQDHARTEATHKPYRNLARDERRDKSTRLMLTQGAALWHPVLRRYLQGEITVDVTDVPGKDRDWLEQVLTPEASQLLLANVATMVRAVSESPEAAAEACRHLVTDFLGESADCVVYAERNHGPLAPVGSDLVAPPCEFDPLAVVRWCLRTGTDQLVIDYETTQPPSSKGGRRSAGFPTAMRQGSKSGPFSAAIIRGAGRHPLGGVFITQPPGPMSALMIAVLSVIASIMNHALATEEKIRESQEEQSRFLAERERQATLRLASQYRHSVEKRAVVIDMFSSVLERNPSPEKLTAAADALRHASSALLETGRSFEAELSEEEFNLAEVLVGVTGEVTHVYPEITMERSEFPKAIVVGIKPFVQGAFENLVLNAVDALTTHVDGVKTSQGRIGVWCTELHRTGGRQGGSFVDVFVCDDGPGPPPDVADKIRLGMVVSTKGRGLGLSIARLTFADMKAELTLLDMPMPGWQGACFRVRMPARVRAQRGRR